MLTIDDDLKKLSEYIDKFDSKYSYYFNYFDIKGFQNAINQIYCTNNLTEAMEVTSNLYIASVYCSIAYKKNFEKEWSEIINLTSKIYKKIEFIKKVEH